MNDQEKSLTRLNYLFNLHRDCIRYLTHLDSLVWQIPTISIAVNAFLASSYINENSNNTIRLVIVTFSLVFNVVALIALVKHRFHSDVKAYELECFQTEIENELRCLKMKDIRRMKVITDDILKEKENYPTIDFDSPLRAVVLRMHISAYHSFKWMLILIICFLICLAVFQLNLVLDP